MAGYGAISCSIDTMLSFLLSSGGMGLMPYINVYCGGWGKT